MSNLLAVLTSASSSLSAQRGLMATAGHNIDNSNTEGYSRQIVGIEAVVPPDQMAGLAIGRGARLKDVTQARDRFLEAQLPRTLAQAAASSAESTALQALQGLNPDSTIGLDTAISGFYSAATALAQNPSDSGLRTAFMSAARNLAQTFNRTAQEVESNRTGLDVQAEGLTGEINAEARAVAELNTQIRQSRGAGIEPNDLLDLRQKHLDAMAELAGATPVPTSEGDVNVVLPGGVAIVAGSYAGTLSTEIDATNGGHLGIVMTLPDGTGPLDLPGSQLGGSLGGTLSARDVGLAGVGSQIDQLAFDLAGAVNTVHAAGYGTGTDPATGAPFTGLPLFTIGAVVGAAGRMAVAITDPGQIATAATAAGVPGDATNVHALLGTETTALSTGKDVRATLSGIVSGFGATAAMAEAFAEQDAAVKADLQSRREAYSGVSIDEEMITLQQAQRGFEAIAKVIQTADSMLETLLNLR